jgi:hypothetical protein
MVVLALVVCIGAWGCGDNDNDAPAEPSAALQCEVVGTLCHDSETAEGETCHALGHDGPPDQCAAQFSDCIGVCLEGDDGDPFCRALGSLCHAVDDDDGPLHACHELGHDGDPDACRRRFEDCAERCLAARE